MTTQPHIHGRYLAHRYRAEGEAAGRAAIVPRILHRRGIDVPEPAHARIAGCTDLDLGAAPT